MNIYSYNPISCALIALLQVVPMDNTSYITTDQTFDLTNFTVTIGQIDGHVLTWWNPPKPKPVSILIQNIQNQNQNIITLQTVTNTNPIDTSTLDGAKQSKLREISNSCQQTIYAGLDVVTTKGAEHFSLTSDDQSNLSALAMAIGTGLTSVPYHADGQLCREFTASEFNGIYTAAKNFVTYNTTLCNHLNVWIRRCETINEVNAITHTSKLPDDLQTNLNSILGIA